MSQDRPFVWECHSKQYILQVELGGVSVNHCGVGGRARTLLTRLMETQKWCPPVSSAVQQRNNGFCQLFCLGESCLFSPCHDVRQFSFSLYVPGTFQAVASVLELRENPNSAFAGLLKEAPGIPSALSITQPTISAGFHSQKLWGRLFLAPMD